MSQPLSGVIKQSNWNFAAMSSGKELLSYFIVPQCSSDNIVVLEPKVELNWQLNFIIKRNHIDELEKYIGS